MIAGFLDTVGNWAAWLILGLVLLGIEVVTPGFFFMWFGIAALIIGAGTFIFDWPWQFQVIGFVVLSVIAVLIGRRVAGNPDVDTADPHLNLRASRLTGRTFVLAEPIVEGAGRVRIDDTIWQIRGADAPAGARIVVTGADGSVLKVESA